MSYGIANRKKYPGFTVSELLKAADEEMYEYKTNYYKHKNMLEDALEGRR
jgi:PleD family two-component response regulator